MAPGWRLCLRIPRLKRIEGFLRFLGQICNIIKISRQKGNDRDKSGCSNIKHPTANGTE